MHDRPWRRLPERLLLGGLSIAVAAAGCGPKNVRWNYPPEATRRLDEAQRIALVADPEIRPLTNAVAGELEFHGYAIVMLEPVPASQPAETPPPPPPSAQPPAGAKPLDTNLVLELSARYVREPIAGTRVRVPPWVSVDVAYGKPKGWYIRVSDAKLDLKDPATGQPLGTVMVHYDEPQEDLGKIAQKLADGLEQIRKGKPPKTD